MGNRIHRSIVKHPPTYIFKNPECSIALDNYSHMNGFGNYRSVAMSLVSNFILSHDIYDTPYHFTDRELYIILTTPNELEVLLIIRNLLSMTSMTTHPLYSMIIRLFHPIYGFGEQRNTAVDIVDDYSMSHRIDINANNFSDDKLYTILLAKNDKDALKAIKRDDLHPVDGDIKVSQTWVL